MKKRIYIKNTWPEQPCLNHGIKNLMLKSFVFFLLIICYVAGNNVVSGQISRTQIINNAAPYTSFTWTASACNLWSGTACGGRTVYSADVPWVNVGTNTSMPYCWGGWSTQEQHITAMANCKSAGDICSASGGGCSGSGAGLTCASGHDCSGLVSRAWALATKQSTSSLPNYSTAIPLSQVQPGDIFNLAGSHVRLVETNYGNGNYRVIEASGVDWKTSYRTYTAAQLASYTPRCPNSNIVSGGCTLPGSVSVSGGGTWCSDVTLTATGGSSGTIYWQGSTSNGTSTDTPSTSQVVTSSGTYYFRAYNSCGWGVQGSATVTINGTPATQASNIAFPTVGSNSLSLSWVNGNGSRRVVYVNTVNSFTDPGNSTDPVANSVYGGSGLQCIFNSTGNSVSVTGLTTNTTYWFRVYEANCTGTSSLYNTVSGTNNPNSQTTTSICTPPVSPTSATASLTTVNSGQPTTLKVNGGSLNSAPNWIWYTGSCGGTVVGAGSSLTVTPVTTTTYYVQATACGTSTTCRSVIIKVIPPAPVAIAATNISATGFSARWNASPGASGYYLDVSTSSSFSSYLRNYKNKKVYNVTTSTVSGLTAGITYYYRVRAYNSYGTSPNSNTIPVGPLSKTYLPKAASSAFDNTTGTDYFEVTMYPNPTRGTVTLDINKNIENLVVSVFNNNGTEVFRKEYISAERVSLDLSRNVPGMYIVKLNSGDKEIIKKLVLDK